MWLNGLDLRVSCHGMAWHFLAVPPTRRMQFGNAPTPVNETLPPNLQPSIASSIPVLAQFKKGLFYLGYNLQLNYTGEVLGNPTGGGSNRGRRTKVCSI